MDIQSDALLVGHCAHIDSDGWVHLHVPGHAALQRAWVQSDIAIDAMRQAVAQGAPVCLAPLGDATWLIKALLHAPSLVAQPAQSPLDAQAPTVLRADVIELGDGAAKLWVEGRTLHCRAFHMQFRAEGQQRLVGATIALG